MPQTTQERTARTGRADAGPEPAPAARRGTVPVLAFAGIVVAVMQTLLVPVIKDLPTLLHTAPTNATWVMTATLLAGAVATPIMGRLGDLYGKRGMLLVSLALMVVGSLVCAVTDQLLVMIVGRALQGFAMGAIPLGIGIMRDTLPRERLGSAMALMSSSIGVGGGLGLPAAAAVAEHADWHMLFYGSAGMGVLSMLLIVAAVPASGMRTPGRFDVLGAIGLSAGLVCLLLPITKGSDWGWAATRTLVLFGAAAVVLVLWGLFELKVRDPLVDLRTTARRQVLLTNLASIMVGVSFYAISLVLPQLLELPSATGYGLGQSLVVAGLCVAPLGLAMMLVSPLSARLSAARGPKASLVLGLLVIAAGYGSGLWLMSAVWQTVIIAVVVGAGIGFAYSSLPALIIGAVDPSETGAANGLNTLMRSIGTSVSSAVIGMVLARMSHPFGPVAVPTMNGFRVSFAIAAGAVVLGLLLALLLPRRRPAGRHGGAHARVVTEAADTDAAATDAVETAAATTPAPSPAVPAPATAPAFRGRVLDTGGSPVPAATVTLVDHAGHQVGIVAADGGAYILPIPAPGPYVLIGAAPGHAPHAAAVLAREGADVDTDLHLAGSGQLLGTLTRPDGTPAGDGTAVVTNAAGEVVASCSTGPDGRWAFSQLPPGSYTLALGAPGLRPEAHLVELPGGEPVRRDARLRASAELHGTVRGPADAPLAGAAVALLDPDGTVLGTSVTGADGAFAFAGLDGDHYTLSASGYPPVAAAATVTGNGSTDRVDLVLRHGE